MGNTLNALKPKPTTEEIEQNMKAKLDYSKDLMAFRILITTAERDNKILPESSTFLRNLIATTSKWLKENPDANASDILTSRLNLAQRFQEIQDTEESRKLILCWLAGTAAGSKTLLAYKSITDEDDKNIQMIVKNLNTWVQANQFTALKPEFEEQAVEVNYQLATVLENNPAALAIIAASVQESLKYTPTQLKAALKKFNIITVKQTPQQAKQTEAVVAVQKKEKKKQSTLRLSEDDPLSFIYSVAVSTFFTLIFFVLLVLSGSFAANVAIGRSAMYRFLYFIYGCVPYFIPFVFVYVIYRRVQFGPIHMYGILPLLERVQGAPRSIFEKTLLFPFCWIPDNYSAIQKAEFMESLKLPVAVAVAAVGAVAGAGTVAGAGAVAGATGAVAAGAAGATGGAVAGSS